MRPAAGTKRARRHSSGNGDQAWAGGRRVLSSRRRASDGEPRPLHCRHETRGGGSPWPPISRLTASTHATSVTIVSPPGWSSKQCSMSLRHWGYIDRQMPQIEQERAPLTGSRQNGTLSSRGRNARSTWTGCRCGILNVGPRKRPEGDKPWTDGRKPQLGSCSSSHC